MSKKKLIFTDNEWTLDTIEKAWEAIDRIAKEKYDLDYYEPQLEVISYEHMLNVYATAGLPNMYSHWSYGKSYLKNEADYLAGRQGLAYEVVINTEPSIAYLMDSNTMTMQTLVMAHACVGHSSFFKNNELFREHTDPKAIIGYLKYAKDFITECENKYSASAVEKVLDAAHSLKFYSIDRFTKKAKSRKERNSAARDRSEDERRSFDLHHYNIGSTQTNSGKKQTLKRRRGAGEENIVKYIMKHSPSINRLGSEWKKEILNITCKINQYFYPQYQTQVMNEGCACFWHYTLMNDLYDEGSISEGSMFEFMASHAGVVAQPPYYSKYYSGINPYALGFNIMKDIRRMCENPTDEDRQWFPDIAGKDWLPVIKEVIVDYRDESFIRQFLSPKVIRDMGLFNIEDDVEDAENYHVTAIHDDEGYEEVRTKLADSYVFANRYPAISVVGHDLLGARELTLEHKEFRHQGLAPKAAKEALEHVKFLWGSQFEVHLRVRIEGTEASCPGIKL